MSRRLTVLLAEDVRAFGRARSDARLLPYRLDHLRDLGWDVVTADPAAATASSRAVRSLGRLVSRLGPPATPTLAVLARLVRGSAVLTVFESEGHFLALLRALLPPLRRRGRMVVVVCWLAELLPGMSPRRRALMRFAYRGVDAVACFSPNQVDVLHQWLQLPRERLHAIPFGIDTDEFLDSQAESPYLLAVGRDRGRDWSTTFAAVHDAGLPLKVLCRPADLKGVVVPPEVEVLGYVPRGRYRELLQSASAVLLLTQDLAYPTGQTVLLEAMSSGRPCVVTTTTAMAGYLDASAVCAVPVGDVHAAQAAVRRLVVDADLRRRLGRAAAAAARRRHGAELMCQELDRLLGLPNAPAVATTTGRSPSCT